MFHQAYLRPLLLIAALLVGGVIHADAQEPAGAPTPNTGTPVHLRWGKRPGVFRYRLQLARNRNLSDIVFDRVVTGEEVTITDLPAGKYFWRIAALTTTLGDYSAVAEIQVVPAGATTQPRIEPASNTVIARGGWQATVGDIKRPVLAHLRRSDQFEVVGTNTQGVTYALDAMSGIALWSFRARVSTGSQPSVIPPLIVPSRARPDNVGVFAGGFLIKLEGASGRELWRSALPAPAASAVVIGDRLAAQIVVVDNTLQRLTIVDDASGRILSQVRLTGRVIGEPLSLGPTFVIGYETGVLEIRDQSGALLKSGDARSPLTTAPAVIRGPRGNVFLVGTRDGLTAMTGDELRPLGRLALKEDRPNGIILIDDLNTSGLAEAIVMTERHHLIAIDADAGKILWDVTAAYEGDGAFADVDGDQVRDLLVAACPVFAVAVSGKDGKVIWKDPETANPSRNHGARSVLVLPSANGVLLIAGDVSGSVLRAMFLTRAARPTAR